MNLVIYYPNGEAKTHKEIKELAITRDGFAFRKGKSPAIYRVNFLVINRALLKKDE